MTDSKVTLLAEIEELMEDTIVKVSDIHKRMSGVEESISVLPEIKQMLVSVTNAQQMIARAAESWAETYRKAEERYEKMENRHEALAALAVGKDQIPLKSHYWSLLAMLVPTLIMAMGGMVSFLYFTNSDIKASLTSLQIGQRQTQELVKNRIDQEEKN